METSGVDIRGRVRYVGQFQDCGSCKEGTSRRETGGSRSGEDVRRPTVVGSNGSRGPRRLE